MFHWKFVGKGNNFQNDETMSFVSQTEKSSGYKNFPLPVNR